RFGPALSGQGIWRYARRSNACPVARRPGEELSAMIAWLLARLNLACVDLDLIARALAADVLRVHGVDVHALNEQQARREIHVRYTELAVRTGLPEQAGKRVADLVWRYIRQAQAHAPQPDNS